jgi:short-subunit dehydrogenase
VLITGVSAGSLGLDTAQAIARQQPALLVLAGRSISKLRDSEAAIRKVTPTASLKLLVVDLASFESIRKAAKEVDYPVDVSSCFPFEALI